MSLVLTPRNLKFSRRIFLNFYLDTSENGNWNRIFVKEIPVNGGCYDVWVIVFYVKGVLLLCMGVVIRASIAGPPVAWAIGLQSPMVKIGTPATNYTARWLSLGRLEIRQMNGITARNLKPVFCNIWFCGRLFLLLLLFCLFRAHFHELVAAVSRTIPTRSEQIAQKQRKKKKRLFYILTAKRWIDFHHLRASRPTTTKKYIVAGV
jgi:hypothetical protein